MSRWQWTISRALVVVLLAVPCVADGDVLDASQPELTLCQGSFALCAAATCTLTGRTFPGTDFPEVLCKCPVLSGQALADVTGGNMQGSCSPPVDPVTKKSGVWSLFWPMLNIPQEINGVWRRNAAALPHNCPSTQGDPPQPVLFGQCFSYACTNVRKVNGVLIADCYCPAQSVKKTSKQQFAVQAGQCQSSVCSQIPVGAPFIVPGSACEKQ
jgi:hypothetical protein